MGFRFWRRVRIAPGVTLNLSKSSGSLSFGRRGAHFTVGPHGRRVTAGIPGTGLFYTAADSGRRGRSGGRAGGRGRTSSRSGRGTAPAVAPEDRLTLGFFKRLVTPKEERAFVDGCRELALGKEEQAFTFLKDAVHLADGAYLAGFLALKRGLLDEAAEWLEAAAGMTGRLDRYFSRYGIQAALSLPVTDEVAAAVQPDLRGVLLGLVEIRQRQKRYDEAIDCLKRLRRLEPEDVVVKLSLAELLLETSPGGKEACRKVVRLAEGIENVSSLHAALLLYKARALRGLGLPEAARDVLTAALRRKKDRSAELLHALRYERALCYGDLGRARRARSDLEKIYAEDPDFEDVAARLGV